MLFRSNAVFGSYFASVKPHKVVFERKKDGDAFISAYALIVAKTLFWGIDDTAKIAFNMNTLYTDYGELIRFNGFGVETIAALCCMMCAFPRLGNAAAVCAAFGVDKEKVKAVEEFYRFVTETKRERAASRAKKASEKE